MAIGPLSTTHVILYAKPQEKVINMASPTDIRKGRVMVYQGAPHLVLEMQHRTQGRQAGFVQTTLRNLQSGSTTTTKFRSTDNVDFMHTTTQKLEYSYKDPDGHHFMDLETYEDTILPSEVIGEDVTLKTTWTDDNRSYHVSSKKIADVLGFTASHTIKDAVSDIKNAFEKGLLQNSMENEMYFNIKRMQSIYLK